MYMYKCINIYIPIYILISVTNHEDDTYIVIYYHKT